MSRQLKEGDKCIVVMDWVDSSLNREGTILKWRQERDECKIDIAGEPMWHHLGFVFPISAREEILRIQTERAKLKLALDDSMRMVYEFCNKVSRGEYM